MKIVSVIGDVTRSACRAAVLGFAGFWVWLPWAWGDDHLVSEPALQLLERRCLSCHKDDEKQGGLSLQSTEGLHRGSENGPVVVPGKPDESVLLSMVVSSDGPAEMPKDADPLTTEEVAVLRQWIAAGAPWPAARRLVLPTVSNKEWWSLKPVRSTVPPLVNPSDSAWAQSVIDLFVAHRQQEEGLSRAPTADRRTLVRRLSFDLLGLPPEPNEIHDFVRDPNADAYDRLVDRMLASPRHGERWARHWLDVVHFGETHGYDKDKPRPNAWPYRDYVIRSLNEDKPYARFVREQVAGDALYPETRDGIEAMGFLSAGPWDFIGHEEVPETKVDGRIARHLDRDDMVSATINTFCSVTVHCAQCHHHKFDPITQEDYYRLHAVFAALDRTNRPFDVDPQVARERRMIEQERDLVQRELEETRKTIRDQAGSEWDRLDRFIRENRTTGSYPTEHGFHSEIASSAEQVGWVQIDLGKPLPIERLVLVGCHDDFAGIGDGFGFPKRFRIEASDDSTFQTNVRTLVNQESSDFPNPGCRPASWRTEAVTAQYVRVTATRWANRANDFIWALAELEVFSEGRNVARSAPVQASASTEAPPRWRRENLVDGIYPKAKVNEEVLARWEKRRQALWNDKVAPSLVEKEQEQRRKLDSLEAKVRSLPAPSVVYAAGIHSGSGAFRGTGPDGGKPREIRLLSRGDVTKMGPVMQPGAIESVGLSMDAFEQSIPLDESHRRRALADWLTHADHPLVWRSIVNRVWLYHFGRGIVDTPNDFGRMGQLPSHPELLDWLADEFRREETGWKHLHRLMVTSSTYRLSTLSERVSADEDNRFLSRWSRRRLEAEEIRDSMLWVAERLDLSMGGPSFQDFVVEKPEHSPHYQYHLADLADRSLHRRSVYRFLVRSQQQPWMATMDGADPSMLVEKRNQTITPLQALALWNNDLVLILAQAWGDERTRGLGSPSDRVTNAFERATGRLPSNDERQVLVDLAERDGWPSVIRVLFNLNEFVFVD